MKRILFSLLLPLAGLGTSAAALSEDCEALNLPQEYLTVFFCEELTALAGEPTRTIAPGDPIDVPDGTDPRWFENPLIEDAYRVDPAKTLALIARIRDAGGGLLN